MAVSRRTLLSAPLIPAGLSMPLRALAQGTPVATPEGEPLPPEIIFERLLASEITSPLFPSDTPNLTAVEWVDSGDSDLDGVVGGVLVQSGAGEDAPLIGVYIVHPTFDSAEERLTPGDFDGGASTTSILWYDGVWESSTSIEPEASSDERSSYALLAVRSGAVIVSAFAEGAGTPGNDLRALANLAGMIDHLSGITSDDHDG